MAMVEPNKNFNKEYFHNKLLAYIHILILIKTKNKTYI